MPMDGVDYGPHYNSCYGYTLRGCNEKFQINFSGFWGGYDWVYAYSYEIRDGHLFFYDTNGKIIISYKEYKSFGRIPQAAGIREL